MRRMEQKLQAASDLKVQMAGMEQEREALTQEKAERQAKVGRTEQKLRKVTAERCAPQPLIILHKLRKRRGRAEPARLGAEGGVERPSVAAAVLRAVGLVDGVLLQV